MSHTNTNLMIQEPPARWCVTTQWPGAFFVGTVAELENAGRAGTSAHGSSGQRHNHRGAPLPLAGSSPAGATGIGGSCRRTRKATPGVKSGADSQHTPSGRIAAETNKCGIGPLYRGDRRGVVSVANPGSFYLPCPFAAQDETHRNRAWRRGGFYSAMDKGSN